MEVTTRIYESSLERKNLPKFGEACRKNNHKCTQVGSEIYMHMTKSQYSDTSSDEEEEEEEDEDPEVILERMLGEIRAENKQLYKKHEDMEKKMFEKMSRTKKIPKLNYNILLLTNLSGPVYAEDLYDIFSKCGDIHHIMVNQYRDNDPICFIRYYKKRHAKEAFDTLHNYRSAKGRFMIEYMPII